jgi:hypothetical protein
LGGGYWEKSQFKVSEGEMNKLSYISMKISGYDGMPVIPATWEVKVEGSQAKNTKPCFKNNKGKKYQGHGSTPP